MELDVKAAHEHTRVGWASPRDYAGYGFRLLVFVVLPKFYAVIFGSVVNFTEGLAIRVTPPDVWETFSSSHAQNFQKLWSKKSASDDLAQKAAARRDNAETVKQSLESAKIGGSILGGVVFDSLIAALVLVGQAAQWVMGFLARVLGILFYVLGPLALVISIPRTSDLAGRWFRMFVTILSWPIFSGLILSIGLSVGSQGLALHGAGHGVRRDSSTSDRDRRCNAVACRPHGRRDDQEHCSAKTGRGHGARQIRSATHVPRQGSEIPVARTDERLGLKLLRGRDGGGVARIGDTAAWFRASVAHFSAASI